MPVSNEDYAHVYNLLAAATVRIKQLTSELDSVLDASLQQPKRYPCDWCDIGYVTIMLVVAVGLMSACDFPLWVAMIMAHINTCGWFLSTRKFTP